MNNTIQTTTVTTTFNPGITQPSGLQHLDILSRYSRFYLLIEQYSPIVNNLDRYISPLWIPIALIGCILCMIIYANPQWRKSLRQDSGILMNPYGYGSLSIYLLILSILHLVQCVLVIIIDLDTPWDTGLLAWNSLMCPLFHCLWTGNRLAIILITITLGIETLVLLQRETNFPTNTILRWIIADGNSRKSIRISIGVILLAGVYGLIELAYWRVQYYNVEYEITQSPNHISLSASSSSAAASVTSLKSSEPLARCEVAGGFQYWFAMKPINRYDIFTEMDVTKQTAELAASYFDYQWITGMIIDCPLALCNVCIGLAIIRAYFMDDLIIRPRYAESRATVSRRNRFEVLHIAIISIIQGLFRLPSALFTMFDPLTRPGEMNLTDTEVLKDNAWQRFFLMLSAKVVGIELGDLTATLLMPICIGFCQEFRENFYSLLKFKTPHKLKTTLLSLNPKHSVSQMITPSASSDLPTDFRENVHNKKIKRPHRPHQHYTDKNPTSYHGINSSLANQSVNHDMLDGSMSERYSSNCHLHKPLNEYNTEIQSETDPETTYDNTKSFHHHCDDYHLHHHHHLHHQHPHRVNQHDLNPAKQCQMNANANKPVKYEKFTDTCEYQKQPHSKLMTCKSDWDLHASVPNSLFCSINKLPTQCYHHSKPSSFTNLYNEENDCEQFQLNKIQPILEHRSYV
ncbi:unnamed protein product [Schistosoma turkestanicum]|nr:unnamed protein product [Schistosoma turkestanicum]